PDLDVQNLMQINLIQGADRVLDAMSEKSSEAAEKYLHNLGVIVHKNVRVTNYDGEILETHHGQKFYSQSVIWSAGVNANAVNGVETAIDRASRIKDNDLDQVEGFSDVFAIGDVVAMYGQKYTFGHPMMGQPGIQEETLLAECLERLVQNKALK